MSWKVTLETWVCRSCEKTYPEVFPYSQIRNGVAYFRPSCTTCDNKNRNKYSNVDPIKIKAWRKVSQERRSAARKEQKSRPWFILRDSRKADKLKNRECDLSIEFISGLISKPCMYCGDTQGQMTLDRINNDLGHLTSNVQPSCLRCNIIRGNMPYEAWEHIIPLIRSARELDLFGSWDGKTSGNSSPVKSEGAETPQGF